MVDPISSLAGFVFSESTTVRIAITLVILLAGHLLVKTAIYGLRLFRINRNEEMTKKEVEKREENLQQFSYILDAVVIGSALLYLNTPLTSEFLSQAVDFLPRLVSVALIGILGIVMINIATKVSTDFLRTIGLRNYFREAGLTTRSFDAVSMLIKGFLYLLLLQVLLGQLGIGSSAVNYLVIASSWAVAFLIAGLLFWGFKDLFVNFAAGVYLKNSRMVRPGEEVDIDGETGEIKDINLFSTTVDTSSGHRVVTPNQNIMESSLRFRRTRSDVETLEEVTNYFVAQNPSFCGPASAEMALEIFGYRHDQQEIGEKSDTDTETGTEPEDLIEAVEELTNNEVRAGWIEYDSITDLGDEFKAWFNDGALVIPNFYKPEIFPDATTGHFVLGTGVEGNEILIMDPSGTNGGVYYVDKDRLLDAMGEFDHSRGYIVLAPEGTTAHWRIKNDLLYADKNYYDEISKTLEARLRKILRQGRIMKDASPSSMENYLENWRSGDRVTRLWSPSRKEEEDEEDEE
jgi:small-conductance mechanosensitive channel